MKCPACGRELQKMEVGDLVVDVCRNGCGGTWFDNFELEKVDEPLETAGEALLDIERDENVKVDYSQIRTCPKCRDIKMHKHFASVEKKVEIDECPGCGGFWLDFGELGKIRRQYSTEEERREAARAYFAELFGDKLAAMHAESEAQLRKAEKIAKALRFICPSYYIPGKQAWGAF